MPANTCPVCDGKMTTTHSKLRVSIIDRRRRCKKCGYKDRVFVREEIIRILPLGKKCAETHSGTSET